MNRRGTWIGAVLLLLRAPRTKENRKFFWGWWQVEGGNHGPKGDIYPSPKYNWLATTRKIPGASIYNDHGVMNYPTWGHGVLATVQTLKNGLYGDILAALMRGNPFAKRRRPINGLSIWLTGKPARNNPAGLEYAHKVLRIGEDWEL